MAAQVALGVIIGGFVLEMWKQNDPHVGKATLAVIVAAAVSAYAC